MAHLSTRNPASYTAQPGAPPTGSSGEDNRKESRYLDPSPPPTPRRVCDHVHEAHDYPEHEVMDVQRT